MRISIAGRLLRVASFLAVSSLALSAGILDINGYFAQ